MQRLHIWQSPLILAGLALPGFTHAATRQDAFCRQALQTPLTHFHGRATAAEFEWEKTARLENERAVADNADVAPFQDIARTPAWAFLSVLNLETLARISPHDVMHTVDRGSWRTRRIDVPMLSKVKDFRSGLGLLARELGEVPQFDLVYNAAGLLIGIVPVVPAELDAVRGRAPITFHYFDLSPYYFELPRFGDPHAFQRWEAMAVTARFNEALLNRYVRAHSYSTSVVRAGGQSPYVVGVADPAHGRLDLISSSVDGPNPFGKDYGPAKTVLFPVLPTVFPPTLASDKAYHHSILGKGENDNMPARGVREGDKVWVVGPGSGFDTWLISLMTRAVIHVSGLNPFEIANVKLFAGIAGFEVEAVVHDNIADIKGQPAFSDLMVDWIFWNMPHLEETVPASPYRRFADHHDGDPGGVSLQRFLWYLPELLGKGLARIWNAGEGYVDIIGRMARAAGIEASLEHITDENAVYTLNVSRDTIGPRLYKPFVEFWPTAAHEDMPVFRGNVAA